MDDPSVSRRTDGGAGPSREQTHQDNFDRVQALQDIPRPVVAAATDYPAGQATRWHEHPRAQLVYAISGVMAVTTEAGVWVVPPERAVWVPGGMAQHLSVNPRIHANPANAKVSSKPDNIT